MAMTLMSLEYVVPDLDRALELLVDHCGMPLISRGPHPELDAEYAMVDAGSVVISLVGPTEVGDRTPVTFLGPNLTQLVFGADDYEARRTGLAEAGASITVRDDSFFITQETIEAVFGSAPVMVVAPEAD